MAQTVEKLHLLFAVLAQRMVVREILDQLADTRTKLVGEVRRRRSDEGIDVVSRRLDHGRED